MTPVSPFPLSAEACVNWEECPDSPENVETFEGKKKIAVGFGGRVNWLGVKTVRWREEWRVSGCYWVGDLEWRKKDKGGLEEGERFASSPIVVDEEVVVGLGRFLA